MDLGIHGDLHIRARASAENRDRHSTRRSRCERFEQCISSFNRPSIERDEHIANENARTRGGTVVDHLQDEDTGGLTVGWTLTARQLHRLAGDAKVTALRA